jgi:NAD-dependent deacetylase
VVRLAPGDDRPVRAQSGDQVIAEWSKRAGTTVVTQNVDDLHLAAGTSNLVRLHGSIWELSCWARCSAGQHPWRDDRVPLGDVAGEAGPPRCKHCGAHARPAVVWFGEALRERDVRAALAATSCDLLLTVGTSAIVYPAAGLVGEARQRGAFTAEINAEVTPASQVVDLAIQGRAELVLPELQRLCTL